MKNSNRGAWRAFFLSFALSLCLLILGTGFITVDYRGRKMTFGDDTPCFLLVKHMDGTAELEINMLGHKKEVDFTNIDKMWDFICDFGCFPHH